LLQRALQQQPDAWDKLVNLYGPLVYRWCRRWGLQPKDAENVGQEVFVRVFQGLPRLRGDRPGDSFRAWLRQIVRNCCRDHARQQKRIAQPTGGNDALERMAEVKDDDPELAVADREDNSVLHQQAVQLIRREFSDRDWTIFQRLVINDESPAAIASDLNASANAVYLVKSRVLRRLREEFAELIDF
jgi:RNA polymerase sigma-70 factor (ECF subfamily)